MRDIINKKEIKNIKKYMYGMFFLKDFAHKDIFQVISSISYVTLLLISSLVGFIPIFYSFANDSFGNHIFFTCAFCFSFVFLFDLILKVILTPTMYGVNSYKLAFKKIIFSFSNYLELATFITTITLLLVNGEFTNKGIVVNNIDMDALIMVVLSFLFILNVSNSIDRILVFSHNINDIKLFRHIIRSKIKIWTIFTIIIVVITLIFSFFIYSYEKVKIPNETDFKNISDAIYFCIVTVTTVGFGDIVAKTEVSRIFVIILMIIGIFLYSFFSSQIISVFTEFFSSKKQISKEFSVAKQKQEEQTELINKIDESIINILYEADLIDKKKFSLLLKKKNATEKYNNKYNEENFKFDHDSMDIYYQENKLGNIIDDKFIIDNAQNKLWAVDKKSLKLNTKEFSTALYHLPMRLAYEVTNKSKKIQVILTSKDIPESVQKLIIYQTKPFTSSICEFNVAAALNDEKEQIWSKFGIYTELSKRKFDLIFKHNKKITALLIKDIIVYDEPKLIQEYGINDKLILKKGLIPLV